MGKQKVGFQTKFEQAANMIIEIANCFEGVDIITVTDSWFGNNGLWKPLRKVLSSRFNMISRLRANASLFALPSKSSGRGRPRRYGKKLGNASSLADKYRPLATELTVNLYGKARTILAY